MKKYVKILCLCMVMVFLTTCLFACGEKPKTTVESKTETTRTTVSLLDREIPITHIEIESALGFAVKEPTITNSGSSLYTSSEDGKVSITISMTAQTFDVFSKSVPQVSGIEEAPNLGEKAFWLAESNVLFAYANGYGISCSVMGPNVQSDSALIGARSIVATIIGKL